MIDIIGSFLSGLTDLGGGAFALWLCLGGFATLSVLALAFRFISRIKAFALFGG